MPAEGAPPGEVMVRGRAFDYADDGSLVEVETDARAVPALFRVQWDEWVELASGSAWVQRRSPAMTEDQAMDTYRGLPGSVRNAVIVDLLGTGVL